ncbi:MAG: stage 0 sporulation family protein [Clostridia bacterium]|nr:stage 0 sporulation family protein [Clostridia bacterium]
MTEVVGVRFKEEGKVYYFAPGAILFSKGDAVIVETARGPEYGTVWVANRQVRDSEIIKPLKEVMRRATPEDKKHNAENKAKETEAFRICYEKIAQHGLDMKLVEAQYTFDNSKLLFYFTSAGRVDFRELVKDLASVFRTRIELRQIGIRDEAKLMGGLGACGRPLCCATFLSDFGQVSIKMAKEQSLSLNSSKISGVCGRLMCCLRYEHEAYVEEIKLTPPVDSVVKTPDGVGTVVETSPLRGLLKVKLKDTDGAPISIHRDQVKVLSRPNRRNDEDDEE